MKPDTSLIVHLMQGLLQSFPEYSAEDLWVSYISQIPGVTDKFFDNEVRDIIEHASNNVSVATDMPQKKLLTPE